MTHPLLASVQVGRARTLGSEGADDPMGQLWTTGIFKTSVQGPIFVGVRQLAGDDQADPVNHGGRDKAICAYPADHYQAWRTKLGIDPFEHGAFGENFTILGLAEQDVCIGDVWSAGEILVQVSQPRQPCWKLARKWRIRDFVDQVVKSGCTGWYFRVLREGQVEAGRVLALVERSHPEWTVAAANAVMHDRKGGRLAAAVLSEVAALSQSWQATLAHRLET